MLAAALPLAAQQYDLLIKAAGYSYRGMIGSMM